MTHRRFASMVLGIAVAAIVSFPASAQGMDSKEIVANVAFAFYVGETSFPAGSYTLSARNIGAEGVTIRPSSGKSTTSMPVITRLAQRDASSRTTASNVVFDTVGDRSYLSEVRIPGREGYLVRATTERHDHVLVGVAN